VELLFSETITSLATTLQEFFWSNWKFVFFLKIFLLCFLLPTLIIAWLKAAGNSHITVWLLGCLEISYTRFSPSCLNSVSHNVLGHEKNVDELFFQNISQMPTHPISNWDLMPIWNLPSRVFTLHIPISILVK
jgi:hypothetical protein